MSSLVFYVLAALTAGCALGVVLNKNTIHASFCLLLSLLGAAGLLVLLDAYLLAVLLVLVYAGAVAALFVFIVMLIGMQGASAKKAGRLRGIAAVLGFALLCFGVYTTFGDLPVSTPLPADTVPMAAQLKLYAQQLFTVYLLPVQIAGFLLLAAMIGVIVVSKRTKEEPADSAKA